MNSVSLNTKCPNFKGNLVLVNKKGDRTLIPAGEVKFIEENSSSLSKGVYIVTDIDKSWGNSYYRLKNIPYQEVVDLYKTAMNTDQDVEINVE